MAARLYVQAAGEAHSLAERNHLTLRASALHGRISSDGG